MKTLSLFILLLISSYGMSQDATCDDFSDLVDYPGGIWEWDEQVEGEIIGTTQDGAYDISFGNSGEHCFFNSYLDFPGIWGFETLRVDFEMSGDNQIARFKIYFAPSSPEDMGFSVNESSDIFLDASFPLTIGGVTVDLDDSPTDIICDGLAYNVAYLTFEGDLSEVTLILGETGILELCINPEPIFDFVCDDFTDEAIYPEAIFGAGELIGYSQGGTQEITVGAGGYAVIDDIGIGGHNVIYEFDSSSQTVQFYIWFDESYSAFDKFSVNGGAEFDLTAAFPITIDGVEIDIDYGVPDPGHEYAHLIFTGEIDVITVLESGELWILELCTTAEPVVDLGCDDFTDLAGFPVNTYDAGELIGYSQGGTQTVTAGADADFVWVNGSNPGIFGGGSVDFEFDGSNQIVRFLNYGALDLFNGIGFTVNGSPDFYLDNVFPMTVDGVQVDLDLSPSNVEGLEYFYLTFTGEINLITQILFESGVVEMCVEANEVIDDAGLETENTMAVLVYPNPATNNVTIQSQSIITSIRITSISGQEIINQGVGQNSVMLDLTDFKSGLYFVKIIDQNGTESIEKLLVQ